VDRELKTKVAVAEMMESVEADKTKTSPLLCDPLKASIPDPKKTASDSHNMGAGEMSISFATIEDVDCNSDDDVSKRLIAMADDEDDASSLEWIPRCARDSTDDRDYGDYDMEGARMIAATMKRDRELYGKPTAMSWDSDSASVISEDSSLESLVSFDDDDDTSQDSHVSFDDDDVNIMMEATREELEDLACMAIDPDTPCVPSSDFFRMAEDSLALDTDCMIALCLQQDEEDDAIMQAVISGDDDLIVETGLRAAGVEYHAGRHRGISGSSLVNFNPVDISEGFETAVPEPGAALGPVIGHGENGLQYLDTKPAASDTKLSGNSKGPVDVAQVERMKKTDLECAQNGARVPVFGASISCASTGSSTGSTVHSKVGNLCEEKRTLPTRIHCVHGNPVDTRQPSVSPSPFVPATVCGTKLTDDPGSVKWKDLDSPAQDALVDYVLNGGNLDIFDGEAWTDVKQKLLTVTDALKFRSGSSNDTGKFSTKVTLSNTEEQGSSSDSLKWREAVERELKWVESHCNVVLMPGETSVTGNSPGPVPCDVAMLHTVQQHVSPSKPSEAGETTKQRRGLKKRVKNRVSTGPQVNRLNGIGQVDQKHAPQENWNNVTTKKAKNAGPFAHERSQGYATSVKVGDLSSIPRASAVRSTEQPTATVTRNMSGFINKSPGISETKTAQRVVTSDSVSVSPVTAPVTSGGASLKDKDDVCRVKSTLNPYAKEFSPTQKKDLSDLFDSALQLKREQPKVSKKKGKKGGYPIQNSKSMPLTNKQHTA
jgi:hypothetical protein